MHTRCPPHTANQSTRMFNRGAKSTFMESGYFSVLATAYKEMVRVALLRGIVIASDSRTQWV